MNNFSHYYLITGNKPTNPDEFLLNLIKCLENGITLIQLRRKDLAPSDYYRLAEQTIKICHTYGAKVLLNNEIKMVQELGADGIHIPSKALLQLKNRPLNEKYIVAASCHNNIELLHAAKINANIVTLSPVLKTTSHPQSSTLGWINFRNLTQLVKLPIFALGGLKKNHLDIAQTNGAHGIAAISDFWNTNQDFNNTGN